MESHGPQEPGISPSITSLTGLSPFPGSAGSCHCGSRCIGAFAARRSHGRLWGTGPPKATAARQSGGNKGGGWSCSNAKAGAGPVRKGRRAPFVRGRARPPKCTAGEPGPPHAGQQSRTRPSRGASRCSSRRHWVVPFAGLKPLAARSRRARRMSFLRASASPGQLLKVATPHSSCKNM